jgi:hypothetical protein
MIDQDELKGISSITNKFLQGTLFYIRICEDMNIKGSSKDLIKFAKNFRESEKEAEITI